MYFIIIRTVEILHKHQLKCPFLHFLLGMHTFNVIFGLLMSQKGLKWKETIGCFFCFPFIFSVSEHKEVKLVRKDEVDLLVVPVSWHTIAFILQMKKVLVQQKSFSGLSAPIYLVSELPVNLAVALDSHPPRVHCNCVLMECCTIYLWMVEQETVNTQIVIISSAHTHAQLSHEHAKRVQRKKLRISKKGQKSINSSRGPF